MKVFVMIGYSDKVEKKEGIMVIKALTLSEAMEIARQTVDNRNIELTHIDIQKDNILYKGDLIFHYTSPLEGTK